MIDRTNALIDELVTLLKEESLQEGINETPISYLNIFKASSLSEAMQTVYEPSLFLIVQGAKVVEFAKRTFRYDARTYLVSSMQLPVSGMIIEASSDKPFLSLQVRFEPQMMMDIIQHTQAFRSVTKTSIQSMGMAEVNEELLDAARRLVRLWHRNDERDILAPLIIKEIFFRVLQGEYGAYLHQFILQGSNAYRIARSLEWILHDLSRPIHVKNLSKKVGMSVASFHRHFKQTTSMSPIQYQKLLRLQQARQLLLHEVQEVGEAAFLVGYESPSQFSREYARLFGQAPSLDIKKMKNLRLSHKAGV